MAGLAQDVRGQNPAINLFSIAVSAGTGCVAAAAFTAINPIGGAIYGMVFSAVSGLATQFFSAILGKSDCANIASFASSLIVAITAGAAITTAAGFPLTFSGGVVLLLAMVISLIAVDLFACLFPILCC